jgi:Protein-tyrosine phosphatase
VIAMNGTDYVEETCANYYPMQDGQTLHAPNGISSTLLQTTHMDHVTVRKLQLTNEIDTPASNSRRLVTQLQFLSWKMYDQVGCIFCYHKVFLVMKLQETAILSHQLELSKL